MENKLNIGVLGGGAIAHTHVRSLLTIQAADLRGVSAPEESASVSRLCESAAVPVRNDPGWLLERSDLQAVVIATPTDTHAELIQRAAAAGLHVFCEKPLARTAREAQAAVDTCEKANVKLSVGHVVRYFPAYAQIREMVHAGHIGAPGMAKCRRVSGPPNAARGWYGDIARSGGLIMDMGVHDFDWLQWCLGPVRRVSALASPIAWGQVAMITLAHQSGAMSSVELSWMDPKGFATMVEVSGPKGLLRHDSRSTASLSVGLWPGPEAAAPTVQTPADQVEDNGYRHELADAISWFGGGPAPRSGALDAVAAVALAEAAQLSSTCREPVTVADCTPDGAS